MLLSSVTTAAKYAAVPAMAIAKFGAANPLVSVTALAILTSDRWMPKVEAGPVAFGVCYASCMAIAVGAAVNPIVGAGFPASHVWCSNLCAPALAAPIP